MGYKNFLYFQILAIRDQFWTNFNEFSWILMNFDDFLNFDGFFSPLNLLLFGLGSCGVCLWVLSSILTKWQVSIFRV